MAPPPTTSTSTSSTSIMRKDNKKDRRTKDGILFPKKTTKSGFRHVILAACCGYFVQKTFRPKLLPYGGADIAKKSKYLADIDTTNTKLQFQKHGHTRKIYVDNNSDIIKGPETVVVDPNDNDRIYVLTEDANFVEISNFVQDKNDDSIINATATIIHDLGMGRPLGGRLSKNGHDLYVADTFLGLTRIQNVLDRKSKLELVTRRISSTDSGNNSTTTNDLLKLKYADDVVIGPKTGRVYFTDASDIEPTLLNKKDGNKKWDTMYASKLDLIRGKPTGRIIQYDPKTDLTTVLADGIHFANGIGIDKDESFLLVGETFGVHLLKYDLTSKTLSVAVDGSDVLPGYIDGVDCSWTTTKCYAVMPSAIVPIHKLFNNLPDIFSRLLRTFLLVLPRWLAPKVKKFGGIVEYDYMTQEVKLYLDPTGQDISMLTGVTVGRDNKLYLGSLENDYIGVYTPPI